MNSNSEATFKKTKFIFTLENSMERKLPDESRDEDFLNEIDKRCVLIMLYRNIGEFGRMQNNGMLTDLFSPQGSPSAKTIQRNKTQPKHIIKLLQNICVIIDCPHCFSIIHLIIVIIDMIVIWFNKNRYILMNSSYQFQSVLFLG